MVKTLELQSKSH